MTGRSSDSGAYAANTEGHTSAKHPAPTSTACISPGAPLSDSSLIARICQRDEQALGLLYDRYDRLVYTIALRITNDHAAAEEVVQDVFQGVWQSAGSFQPYGSVSVWLIGIARHRAIDATRTHGYRVQAHAAVFDDAHMSTTSENSAGRTDVLTVRAAICALPAKQREAINLAYYGGLTRAEIAAQLGESLGMVNTRLRLGLSALRAWLRDGAEDSG